jgi:nitrite reductase/ring-hydroxylating ferredoxin subunit
MINEIIEEEISFEKLPHRYISKVMGDEILLYTLNGKIYAVSGFCPHFGGPLELKDKSLTCYWHDWSFDAAEFFCKNRKINIKIKKYSVKELYQNKVRISNEI